MTLTQAQVKEVEEKIDLALATSLEDDRLEKEETFEASWEANDVCEDYGLVKKVEHEDGTYGFEKVPEVLAQFAQNEDVDFFVAGMEGPFKPEAIRTQVLKEHREFMDRVERNLKGN